MVGPSGVASPMMTAFNFISDEPSPDNIYAAPRNATVFLGVGQKGDDASRYGGKIIQNSKIKRPDLTIIPKAVGPFTHDQKYLELLKQHPAIAKSLNKGRGRVSPEEISDEERLEGKTADRHLFHASDMRDFIDLASEDAIGLEFLRFFVPLPEDVFAIMGILGINPADIRGRESDQVIEPELDDESNEQLENIIKEELDHVLKEFGPGAPFTLYKLFKKGLEKYLDFTVGPIMTLL